MSEPLIFRFFTEIGIIEQLARTEAERRFPPGLSLAGFGVLNHLTLRGPTQSPNQIASAMQVTRGAVTGTLKRLQSAGWVAVTPDPDDGRGKRVTLTAAGAATREAGIQALAEPFGALLAQVGAEEIAAVLPLLTKVRIHMDAARD